MSQLPKPDFASQLRSESLKAQLSRFIKDQGGRIDFADYMAFVLYEPELGYYCADSIRLGKDFITAPEISPLFGQCLARSCIEVLSTLGGGSILELGAGSGALALDLLTALTQQNISFDHYWILERSPALKAQQQALFLAKVPELFNRIHWLPEQESLRLLQGNGRLESFKGVILANEVLDALPVQRFCLHADSKKIDQYYVAQQGEDLIGLWDQPNSADFLNYVQSLKINFTEAYYTSEICLNLYNWMQGLSACLKQGLILLIDYGFPQREFYHSDRSMGTLMCHYRHYAHTDPFIYLGLQDITAHVDFTAVAEAGQRLGLDLIGFTTQAGFLLNSGLLDLIHSNNERERILVNRAIEKLTSPAEMGELFKVIGLAKGLPALDYIGFQWQDHRHRL